LNFQKLNGNVADKNTLLLDFDPEAPPPDTPSPNDPFKQFTNLSSQQDNKTEILLDFEDSPKNANKQEQDLNTSNNSALDTTSSNTDANVPLVPQSNQQDHQSLKHADQNVHNAAQESASKHDLLTTPSSDTEQQPVASNQSATSPKLDSTLPTASPAKKPAASTARPASATKTKPTATTAATTKSTEHKPNTGAAAATASKSTEHKPAASTTKSTESKPSATTRKTIHSAPTTAAAASNKTKVTPTSPAPESSTVPKPTVNITKLI